VVKLSAIGTETILYSFESTSSDGDDPSSSLIMGSAGSLYGTTPNGGANGYGTAFKVN
jgi:hypothetical protein